jgi:hypothetical protein
MSPPTDGKLKFWVLRHTPEADNLWTLDIKVGGFREAKRWISEHGENDGVYLVARAFAEIKVTEQTSVKRILQPN